MSFRSYSISFLVPTLLLYYSCKREFDTSGDPAKISSTLFIDQQSSHKKKKSAPSSYWIENGQFYTHEGKVPAGCFAQLMTELNGDDHIAAVFLNRTLMRGCIAANTPYPSEETWYSIVEDLQADQWVIEVCDSLEGTMRKNCERFLTRFYERTYRSGNQTLKVLSIEKLGQL